MNAKVRKYVKHIISVFTVFAVGATIVNASTSNYTTGSIYYTINMDGIEAGEEYKFYLPFDAESVAVTFNSETESGAVTDFVFNNETFQYTGNSAFTYSFKNNAFMGDASVRFQSSNNVSIKSITYNKRKKTVAATSSHRSEINLGEYEKAIHTAVIINKNLPVIKVNGAFRYIDYDNASLTPKEIDGKVYLPLKTLGFALGFYTEELENENYALLRNDTYEYVLKNNNLYSQIGGSKYAVVSEKPIVIQEGSIWADAEYFAELIGKTVVIKDEYIFIDYYELANKLATDKLSDVEADFSKFSGQAVNKTTYYVDASTQTSGSGTEAKPFKTISEAAEVAQPGDTVIIKAGIYHETVIPKNSGTAANPIVYKAEGQNVVISAIDEVDVSPTTEIVNGKNLYVYSIANTLGQGRNMVFFNSEAKAEGRHPNSHTALGRENGFGVSLSPLWPTMGAIDVLKDDNNPLTAGSNTELNQADDFWNGGTLVSLHGSAWNLGTAKITDSTSGKLTLSEPTETWWFENYSQTTSETDIDYAYITNHINTVDMPGEWYWNDAGKLYIYPYNNTAPEKLEVKARQVTVDLSDKEYVHFVGINTIGGGMTLDNSTMCVINGGEHKYISHYTYTKDQHYNFIEDYAVGGEDKRNYLNPDGAPIKGEMGFYIGGRDNAVVNTKIKYSAAAGLYVTGSFGYFENNMIDECGYMSSYVGGIFIVPNAAKGDITDMRGGHSIYKNTVSKSGRAALLMVAIEDEWFSQKGLSPYIGCDIAYNKFSDGCIASRDTGVVYVHGVVAGDDRLKTKIHHNVVANNRNQDGYGILVYFDNYVQQIDCFSNVVYSENKTNKAYINVQNTSGSHATVECWNNSILGASSTADTDKYPMGKYFTSGYDSEANAENFNNFNASNGGYSAVKDEQKNYVYFENVDFGTDNSIRLMWYGDYTHSKEKIEIRVGKGSFENADIQYEKITPLAAYKDALMYTDLTVKGCAEKRNVYIKAPSTVKIVGIDTIKVEQTDADTAPIEKHYFAEPYAVSGETSKHSVNSEAVGDDGKPIKVGVKPFEYVDANKSVKDAVLCDLQSKPVLKYKAVEIIRPVSHFTIAYATTYTDQKFEVRVNSLESDPIATFFTANKDSWNNFAPVSVGLNKVLSPGKYDVYITVATGSKTSDLYWFGFSDALEVYEISGDRFIINNDNFKFMTGTDKAMMIFATYNNAVLENAIKEEISIGDSEITEKLFTRENDKTQRIFMWSDTLKPLTKSIDY